MSLQFVHFNCKLKLAAKRYVLLILQKTSFLNKISETLIMLNAIFINWHSHYSSNSKTLNGFMSATVAIFLNFFIVIYPLSHFYRSPNNTNLFNIAYVLIFIGVPINNYFLVFYNNDYNQKFDSAMKYYEKNQGFQIKVKLYGLLLIAIFVLELFFLEQL